MTKLSSAASRSISIGRQPTMDGDARRFWPMHEADKRARLVEKLLASPEFGANWANYWSDVISYRTPEPELTFLNYTPFKDWLAEQFNANKGWDETTYNIVTAIGKVADNPAATYIGFHQGDKSRLASETTRVFLSTQIQCAECHDHKFIDMPQETFHHVAAFFVPREGQAALERLEPDRRHQQAQPASTRWTAARTR